MKNKYTYLFILQGFYGSWDDLTESKSSKEVRDDRKAYRDNEGGSYRIIRRRGLNVA